MSGYKILRVEEDRKPEGLIEAEAPKPPAMPSRWTGEVSLPSHEVQPQPVTEPGLVGRITLQAAVESLHKIHVEPGLAEWKRQAQNAVRRLQNLESQNQDLRQAADELRARALKSKDKLDAANRRATEMQVQLIEVMAERDSLRQQVADQEVLARKVWEFRQTLLNGPLWDLFAELTVCLPKMAGGEATSEDTQSR